MQFSLNGGHASLHQQPFNATVKT